MIKGPDNEPGSPGIDFLGHILDPNFSIGDYVKMDGDEHMKGLVTAITIRGRGNDLLYTFEVSWFNSGSHHQGWFEEWRLATWEE